MNWSSLINCLLSTFYFGGSLWLLTTYLHQGTIRLLNNQFYFDAFNVLLILLSTFIGLTTAIFSYHYMQQNWLEKRISLKRLHFYNCLYQIFLLAVILALSTNNIGILWVAMESATLATVLLVSLYRSPESVEAAWKYFIICVVGIALALFGTILLYCAAQDIPNIGNAILWNNLYHFGKLLDKPIISLAFVFLFVGYGTKIGLVPLHHWLPDTYSKSPGPISALLSSLLMNVALYALIRFKIITDLALTNNLTTKFMLSFGILAFLFASLILHKQNNIKRMFSYLSIEHTGIIIFAFGLGTQAAAFAALLYLFANALVKSAIFTTVANIMHITHTQNMEKIRGLLKTRPILGWLMLVASLAALGMPPSGMFTGEILIFIATLKQNPWLIVLLGFAIISAFAAILHHMQQMLYSEVSNQLAGSTQIKISTFPAVLHLAIAVILGVYLPIFLGNLFTQASILIANQL